MSLIPSNTDETYIKLVKKFFKGSLNFCLQPEEIESMTWEWQQKFLDATFNCDLIKKYPVNNKFARLFLKKVLSSIEGTQEVHDDIYTQLCLVMNEDNEQDGFCYRHYVIGKDLNNVVTLKETKNTVVNGTTGMKTWEAAFVLSDWALSNKEVFASKKVLELGSGVGFTGITLAKFCDPSMLLFSDCHNDVLKTICDNIQINCPKLVEEDLVDITYYRGKNSTLGVMMLDWNDIGEFPWYVVPDIIIGADIVYDPVILEPLCNVLDYFYKRNQELEVYIASVVRNEDTFAGFLKALEIKHFIFEELLTTEGAYVDWDSSTKVCFLKIKKKS